MIDVWAEWRRVVILNAIACASRKRRKFPLYTWLDGIVQ